jgi:hypothetical protein
MAMPSLNWTSLTRRRLLAGVAALWMACGTIAPVAAAMVQERSVKAAFLAKFVAYVDFDSPVPGAPLVIGVVGSDSVGSELARVAAQGSGGRPIAVRMLAPDQPLAGVQVLFIGGAAAERAPRLLRAAAERGVLTVTEFDAGLREGSVINFRLVDERVRFEVSLAAADKAGLKLSSRLLSVAYRVLKTTA